MHMQDPDPSTSHVSTDPFPDQRPVTRKSETKRAQAARKRLDKLRQTIASIDLLCSGTLVQTMMKCGKPNCHCATDPAARHGPYFQWGRMRGTTAAHRYVTPEQALVLRQAIDNHRLVKKLLRAWEADSEFIIDTEHPKQP